MAINNDFIADQFSLLSKLMDIHGENSFKTKSYSIAAFTIEKLPEELADMPPEKIFSIKGIGENIGKKIIGLLETNELPQLNDYVQKTPPGIIEMLNIKGIGPKKIATIWKEMEIESIGELLYACNENRLMLFKGFGEKTQKNVKETIEFYFRSQGSYLFAQAESYATAIDKKLKIQFPSNQTELTGEFKRQMEIINRLEWVTTTDSDALQSFFETNGFTTETKTANSYSCKGAEGPALTMHCTNDQLFHTVAFETSCSEPFLAAWKETKNGQINDDVLTEAAIFEAAKMNYIPSFAREKPQTIALAKAGALPVVITAADVKAVIHSHSKWSDGAATLEQMAKACIQQGYEYLVISDHSKSAFYANGLTEERIIEQHKEIDELNNQLAPFKIFKSIECDILNDGSLDYADDVLATFDLVITSVHSNLKMTEEKAMARLMKAIANPYTTILGHMTGRLLLSRPGYPVDHKAIIDACAVHKVVIELNAHPRRLDIDWRWIEYAIEKGVMISIDPDAHSTEGYNDIAYGILSAQKALVTKVNNLSSFSLQEFEDYLAELKKAKNIA